MFTSRIYLYCEIIGIRCLTIFIQLLFIKYITNIVGVDKLGIYYFLSTLSYTLNAIILVPLDYFQQTNLYKYINEGFSLKIYTAINKKIGFLIFLLVIIGNILFLLFKCQYHIEFTVVVLLSLCTYLSLLLRGIVNNLEYRRWAAYNLLLESILRIAYLVLLFYVFSTAPVIILIALLLASITVIVCLYFFVKRLPQYKTGKMKNIDLKYIWKFSYPLSIGSVINWIQLQGYRILLVPLGFSEIVGFYATVSNIGNSGMSICATIYNQLFLPDLYKSKGRFFSKYIKYALLIILIVIVISMSLKDFIVITLTKDMYLNYSYLIFFGILTEGGNFLIGNFTAYLGICNSTSKALKASFVGVSVFILLFVMMLFTHTVYISTIGIPIVVSQIVIVGYLSLIIIKFYRKE